MGKDKKILLYRIDEQAKNVIFVVTEDNESVWEKISEDAYNVISFDDVFRDITEFRNNFLDYEQLTDELIGAINGRGAVFREILERFDDNRLNSFNFFTRYYSDTLRDVFTEARADIDKAGAFFNTRALKKSTEYVNDVFNHIREVMRDDWNFDFNSESDMKAFRLSFDKIIIRGNDRNDIYTIADTALVNFFYDFSFAIHKMKLYVCKCSIAVRYSSERKMLLPVKQRTVRQPISVKSRMQKGAKERTALIRYTAQDSVIISVSRKQNCLPKCLMILHLWRSMTSSARCSRSRCRISSISMKLRTACLMRS